MIIINLPLFTVSLQKWCMFRKCMCVQKDFQKLSNIQRRRKKNKEINLIMKETSFTPTRLDIRRNNDDEQNLYKSCMMIITL